MSEPATPPATPPVIPAVPPIPPVVIPPTDPIITHPQDPSSSPDYGERLAGVLKSQLGDTYPKGFDKIPLAQRIIAMEAMASTKKTTPPKVDPKPDIQIPGAPKPDTPAATRPKSILQQQKENGYDARYGKNQKSELIKKLTRKKK